MTSFAFRGQSTTVRQLAVLALIAFFLFASTAFPSPAAAASSVTVKGEVQCLNSSPVGVWVIGEKSKSGWAKVKTPIKIGGHSKLAYEYKLNKGGKYKVHVGCGGTTQKWKKELKSGYLSGTKNNVKCNDISPWLQKVGQRLIRVDVSQGVKYGTCKKV